MTSDTVLVPDAIESETVARPMCRSFAEAFYFDQPDMQGQGWWSWIKRYRIDERYQALVIFRAMQYAYTHVLEVSEALDAGAGVIGKPMRIALKVKRRWYNWLTNRLRMSNYRNSMCDFSPMCAIGRGFWGIFRNIAITATAEIGENAYIEANVTIADHAGKCAVIGNDVHIRTGVVIIGNITIGDNARVGANSLVAQNVPDNTTVLGVPAKPIFRKR